MIDLSIIIVNTNNCKILEECLASVFAATHSPKLEVIVSDNGSTDGSQEMIRSKFPQVKLIENGENLGFIKASNKGLNLASGRYLMLLNDDTLVKDSALDKMMDFMDANPMAGACGPLLLNPDGTPQRQGGLFGSKFWKSNELKEVKFIIGACLMLRREVFEQIGPMDEKLFFYNDDLDWCMSIRRAGWKIYFLPQAQVMHYGGYSSKRVFNRRLFVEGFRGGLYFCRKHYGLLVYIAYRILLTILILIYLPFFILSYPLKRGKFKDRLLAYFDIIKIAIFGNK